MKQKITISLPVNGDKCRAKAMQIAVAVTGVGSVNIDPAKNHLVVTGEGVDSFQLIKCLKRKFKCASIVSIEEVKPPQAQQQKDAGGDQKKDQKDSGKKDGEKKDGEKKDGEKKDGEKKEEWCKPCPCPPIPPCVQYYPVCQPVYDPYPQNCSIL